MSEKETTAAAAGTDQPADQDLQPPSIDGATEEALQEPEVAPDSSREKPPEEPTDSSQARVSEDTEPVVEEQAKIVDNIGPEPAEIEILEAEVAEEPDPLATALDENKRLREKVLRLAADFDNFRKRARRDNEESARRARVDLLRELLPVFDNMERAVAHAEQAPDVQAVATGVKMVVKQFQDVVGRLGVERIEAVGAPFDPNVHEAIQQVETADQPAGTVVAEMLTGYRWGERLLRAAMVVVAKAPPSPVPDEAADGSVVTSEADGGDGAKSAEVVEDAACEEKAQD